jgi:hypothetical protein
MAQATRSAAKPAQAATAAKPAPRAAQAAAPVDLTQVPVEAEQAAGEVSDDTPEGTDGAVMEEGGEGNTVIDLTQVPEGGGFETVPRGMYPCELVEVEYGLSQRSGNPMWTTVWEVEQGHEYAERRFWFHVVLTPKQFPRVVRFLNRIGRPDLTKQAFDAQQIAETGELIGCRAKLRITIRPYEGEQRNNVGDVLPADAPGAGGGDFLQSGG